MKLPSTRPDEQVAQDFTVSTHYTVAQAIFSLLLPVLLFGLAVFLGSLGFIPQTLAPLIQGLFVAIGGIAGLYLLLGAIYLRLARHYFVTNERILQINGWLAQQVVSVDYNTITDMTIQQDVLERFLLQTGTIMIDTAGQPSEEIALHHIANPMALRDQILGQIEACRVRTGNPVGVFKSATSAGATAPAVPTPPAVQPPIEPKPSITPPAV